MQLHHHTAATPELNLALDESLLLGDDSDHLRFWEPGHPFVVLGRSSSYDDEVAVETCGELRVPILRRVSGGATIVTGPGCLMYAVVLDLRERPALMDLTAAHRYVLGKMVEAIKPLEPTATIAGTSDLAFTSQDALRKFSGNSVRRVRGRLLYHGTLLYNFDLPLISRLLQTAPRQPEYRTSRDHDAFVANLEATRAQLIEAIAAAWRATPSDIAPSIHKRADELVAEKYAHSRWNTHGKL
ncbi:lipoate--protein ligase family protein [Botrimarina mediterranea]|uniref:Putative lipoate-protein ligase A n=1 Tax=Botrimarina mediterranea TaxID=2528022 RepID=A0A518KEE2_9BACT|nr:lipoate--protein ligase family protein [Botrimarina mediterranea]QDV76139.1 putative lipoate-protein ligase A [Botrimarina mediterranea]QDV80736.1 putative lipoate-protein ligase A [Planctomycetes bacterium K2D]